MTAYQRNGPIGALALGLCLVATAWPAATKEKVAYLGVAVAKADETTREQLKLKAGAGLTVQEVSAGSPADKAGLKKHDVLQKLDDQLLFNPEQMTDLVRSRQIGDQVALTLLRQAQAQTVEVTLGETEAPKPGPRPAMGGMGGMGGMGMM